MSFDEKQVATDIKEVFTAADDAEKLQMLAYARGLNDGKKLAELSKNTNTK